LKNTTLTILLAISMLITILVDYAVIFSSLTKFLQWSIVSDETVVLIAIISGFLLNERAKKP
jgi:hypothetical protein